VLDWTLFIICVWTEVILEHLSCLFNHRPYCHQQQDLKTLFFCAVMLFHWLSGSKFRKWYVTFLLKGTAMQHHVSEHWDHSHSAGRASKLAYDRTVVMWIVCRNVWFWIKTWLLHVQWKSSCTVLLMNFFYKRDLLHREYTLCTRINYKIVSFTNMNKYLCYDTSGTEEYVHKYRCK
jgi:hypothetical protein